MTREEAIRIFQSWIDWDSKLQYADREENIEIYKMAIKALEQQSALEDIKAKLNTAICLYNGTEFAGGLKMALQIIDKYISRKEQE